MFPGGSSLGIGGLFSKFAKLAKWRIFQKMSEIGLCNFCHAYAGGRIAFIVGMELPSIDPHRMEWGLVNLGHLSEDNSLKTAKN